MRMVQRKEGGRLCSSEAIDMKDKRSDLMNEKQRPLLVIFEFVAEKFKRMCIDIKHTHSK